MTLGPLPETASANGTAERAIARTRFGYAFHRTSPWMHGAQRDALLVPAHLGADELGVGAPRVHVQGRDAGEAGVRLHHFTCVGPNLPPPTRVPVLTPQVTPPEYGSERQRAPEAPTYVVPSPVGARRFVSVRTMRSPVGFCGHGLSFPIVMILSTHHARIVAHRSSGVGAGSLRYSPAAFLPYLSPSWSSFSYCTSHASA